MFQEEEASRWSTSEVEDNQNLSMPIGTHWTFREEMAIWVVYTTEP